MKFKSFVAAGLLTLSASSVFAATTNYTDITSWSDDIAGIITTDTYNSYDFTGGGSNIVVFGNSTTLGGITYTTNESSTILAGLTKDFPGDASYLKSNFLTWVTTDPLSQQFPFGSLTISLNSYTRAIGFNFGSLAGFEIPIIVTLGNGDSFLASGNPNAFAFSGSISDTYFNTLTISAPFLPTLDNLSLGPVVAIPEPESYALFLAGLGVMGAIARRRRATQK